jgi:hypothetical protein
MKISLTLWGISLSVVPRILRRKLVMARRSPRGRPKWVNRFILTAKRLTSGALRR